MNKSSVLHPPWKSHTPQTPCRKSWCYGAPWRASQTASLWAARDRLEPKDNYLTQQCHSCVYEWRGSICATCGRQERCGRNRQDFRWRTVIWVEISYLETISGTKEIRIMKGRHEKWYGKDRCVFVPPVDEDAHEHQQTEDGESGDDSQRDHRPLLTLNTFHQPNPGLMAAVAVLWMREGRVCISRETTWCLTS